MKIHSFHVRCVSVPLPVPHKTASGTVTASPLVLLTLKTDDGLEGHSVIFTYTPTVLGVVADLLVRLEQLIAGQPLDPLQVNKLLRGRFKLLGPEGLLAMAIAGIDMAVWDAHARAHEKPLYALLGGSAKHLPAYGGIGFDGPRSCAEQAAAWVSRGLRGVKAKIGYPTVQDDLEVIRSIRAAVGADVAVMVDYNQSLAPLEARNRVLSLASEQLEWIEEPVAAADLQTLGLLAQRSSVPLQAGENWWNAPTFNCAAALGASQRFMPDVMKCGGVTGWMEVESIARSHDIPISNHLWPEVSAHLMLASETAGVEGSWLEYFDWWNPILEEPLGLFNGLAVVPDRAGSGISFNKPAVLKYQV